MTKYTGKYSTYVKLNTKNTFLKWIFYDAPGSVRYLSRCAQLVKN